MGCACNKKRRGTAYGSPATFTPNPEPRHGTQTVPEGSDPIRVQFPSGEIREYSTRLEAHAAKILAGGGEILEP